MIQNLDNFILSKVNFKEEINMEDFFNVSWLAVLVMLISMSAITFGTPKLLSRVEKVAQILDGVVYNDVETSGISVVSVMSLIAYVMLLIISLFTWDATIFISFVMAFFLWLGLLAVAFSIETKLN